MGFLAFFLGMYSGPSSSSGSSAFLSLALCGPTLGCVSALELNRRAEEGARGRKHWHTAGGCVKSTQRGTTWVTPAEENTFCQWWFPLWRPLDSRVTPQAGSHVRLKQKKKLLQMTIYTQARWINKTVTLCRNLRCSWHWWVLPLNAVLTADTQGAAIFVAGNMWRNAGARQLVLEK